MGFTTQSIEKRWTQHKCDAKRKQLNYPLFNAINKYGFDNFEINVLGEYATEQEGLEAEIAFITSKSTLKPNGYNIASGGNIPPKFSTEEYSNMARKRNQKLVKEGYWTDERKQEKVKQLQEGRKKKSKEISEKQRNRMLKRWEGKRKKDRPLPPKPEFCERGCGQPAVHITNGDYTDGIRMWVCGKYATGCKALTSQRSESYKKTMQKLTPEERHQRAKRAWTGFSAEERKVIGQKSLKTRLENQRKKNE